MAYKRKAGEGPDYEFLGYYDPRPTKSARLAHQGDVREQMNMSTRGFDTTDGVGAVTYAFSMRHKMETLENELKTAKSIAKRTQAQRVEQEEHVAQLDDAYQALKQRNQQLESELAMCKVQRQWDLGGRRTSQILAESMELQSLRQELEETEQKLVAEEICHKSAVTQVYNQSDEIERQESVIKGLMKEKMQMTKELEGEPKAVARIERRLQEKNEALKSIASEARRLAAIAEGSVDP